jgi:hypothetical protein
MLNRQQYPRSNNGLNRALAGQAGMPGAAEQTPGGAHVQASSCLQDSPLLLHPPWTRMGAWLPAPVPRSHQTARCLAAQQKACNAAIHSRQPPRGSTCGECRQAKQACAPLCCRSAQRWPSPAHPAFTQVQNTVGQKAALNFPPRVTCGTASNALAPHCIITPPPCRTEWPAPPR